MESFSGGLPGKTELSETILGGTVKCIKDRIQSVADHPVFVERSKLLMRLSKQDFAGLARVVS